MLFLCSPSQECVLSAHYLSYHTKVEAIPSINLRGVFGEEKDPKVLQMGFFFLLPWQNHQSADEME